MKPELKALVVDDDRSWRDFYVDELRLQGIAVVKVATNLSQAEAAVRAMRFAIAIIDVGLDESDDRNVDGLQVMQRIRDAGDQTSIIVVTGRSGRDVVTIVRDSIKKFGALDTVAKATLIPADLRRLVNNGIRAYGVAISGERQSVHDTVRGDVPQMLWDDEIMRRAGISGGVVGFKTAVEGVFGSFLPLLAGSPKGVHILNGVACGVFWSRGIGEAIVGCLGEPPRIHEALDEARATGLLLGTYRVKEMVQEYKSKVADGAVYVLVKSVRDEYVV